MSKFKPIDLARIHTVPLTNISCEDDFFDSLRDDYPEFDSWYRRVANQGRTAWVVDSNVMGFAALCIFKIESHGERVTDDGETLAGNFLKLCTFKVKEHGIKYGERLLYAAFQFAIRNELSAIYIQVRNGHHYRLVNLLKTYGFHPIGQYQNDVSYVKQMVPGLMPVCLDNCLTNLKYGISYYPYHLDGSGIKKFLVSLSQMVHDNLFPDARTQTLAFPVCDNPVVGEAHAIRKAIIQNGSRTSVRPGDLLFFYTKGAEHHMDCMGIVEDYYLCSKKSDIPIEVADRLPFSAVELVRLMGGDDMMIINFRLIEYLDQPITRKTFVRMGFDTNHRSVRQIPEHVYTSVIKPRLGGFGVS